MAFIDYYKILGIPKTATEKEIKSAYRKMARKYHPDVNPNNKDAEQKFKEANEANEVLSNPENRTKYDKYGKDWKHGEQYEQAQRQQQSQRQYQQQSSQSYSNSGYSDGGDFSDYFESMFGGAGRSRRSSNTKFKGQDFNAELHLSLKDVYETEAQVLTVNNKKIRLTIPAGVENGQVIKIKGKGSPGTNGGPNGDLYITFVINNDTAFKRDKANLYADIDLDIYTAVLGGEVTVDTFTGKAKLKVKPGTQGGAKVKLSGKGFPVYKKEGKFGDLIITYQVKIPTELTAKQKSLFEELQKQS